MRDSLATATDDMLRAALADAEVPALLPALALATGDLSLLREDLRPPASVPLSPQGGLSDEAQRAARDLAFDVLRRMRDGDGAGGAPPAGSADGALARRLLDFALGAEVNDEYLPLLWEELAIADPDPRAPAWRVDTSARSPRTTALVVGAGMSGLLAAHRLTQAGVEVTVVEKNPDVGGTWFDNVYPGCRVDVPNAFYSYSFAQRDDWPYGYTPQPLLLDYLRDCAERFGLRDRVRFATTVVEARFDEDAALWQVRVQTTDAAGRVTGETLEATVFVSAVGQLNQPNRPDIPGHETFAGPSWHSARWRDDVDLRGRRVAVIGNAASAMQLMPRVAEQARELHIFQRTPNWMLPNPSYHDELPAGLRWLLRTVPFYRQWYRILQFWRIAEGLTVAIRVEPDKATGKTRPNEFNDLIRAFLTSYLEAEFADRPDLLAAVVPNYPPLAKRPLLDNGSWAATLKRDNVRLVTSPITAIRPDSVVTADGPVDTDVIIYATGFRASEFLAPMRVFGRDGVELHEKWAGEPRAYLGVTVPDFPNLFCLYGPNTNVVANGSIIFMSECSVTHMMECLRALLSSSAARTIECTEAAFDVFNAEVDEANAATVWGSATVPTWYKNAAGRVTQNWPYGMLEYWRRTRTVAPGDYHLT